MTATLSARPSMWRLRREMARKRFPKVRAASISASRRAMEVLANARWFGQVERLWVCTDERGLRALARSGRLRALIELQVASDDGEPLDGAAVRALVRSHGLRRLERLRFQGGDSEAERSIGTDGAIAIAAHARLPHLRALRARGPDHSRSQSSPHHSRHQPRIGTFARPLTAARMSAH